MRLVFTHGCLSSTSGLTMKLLEVKLEQLEHMESVAGRPSASEPLAVLRSIGHGLDDACVAASRDAIESQHTLGTMATSGTQPGPRHINHRACLCVCHC